MTVTASLSLNPKTILSGEYIHVFDTSTSSGEEIITVQYTINETKTVSASSSPNLYIANASTLFTVGDMVLWGDGQPTGFFVSVTYYVKSATTTYITLSLTNGGAAVEYSSAGTTPILYKGCYGIRYPVLHPYPVSSPVTRSLYITITGSNYPTTPYSQTYDTFYTTVTPSTHPVRASNFADFSIFIHSPKPTTSTGTATIINRKWTPNQGFVYSDLIFTNSINKAGTASFTITAKGTQTAAEEALLLSDNYVVIISGDSVVWSGKILRSTQSKMTLFGNTTQIKQWDIECESDLSKLRLQNIKTANKGIYTGSIGYIVTKLLENDLSTDINWNGTTNDPALRSNEGPSISFTITDADMFTQLTSLRNTIDLDMRTRLVYQRYHYTSILPASNNVTISGISPYGTDAFSARWVLITSQGSPGITTYGKPVGNNSGGILNGITLINPTLVTSNGTLIILGDPVLDFVSDLSQSSPQANFRGNTTLSTTYSTGYEFDDKTDRKSLATKVVAKGKTDGGITLTSSIAAISPWIADKQCFTSSSYITKRTEGVVVGYVSGEAPFGTGEFYTEGWGYDYTTVNYFTIRFTDGEWYHAHNYTYCTYVGEVMYNGKRATKWTTLILNKTTMIGAVAHFIRYADLGFDSGGGSANIWWTPYHRIYISAFGDISWYDNMPIYLGGDVITLFDWGIDPVYGYYYRYVCTDATRPGLTSHGPGTIYFQNNIYSEVTPVTGSPVYYHGVILQTYVSDSSVTYPILEMYATMCLIANSYYYRKASFWCPAYEFYKTDIHGINQLQSASSLMAGDRIAFLPKSTDIITDTLYGQLKNIWQIVSFTVDTNTMQVRAELGDFERNVFTLLADKTAAINQTIT
jgi:hypothetical protein